MVLLDPPSFAHERKGKQTFSISRDLPGLVTGATALLRPGGVMMVSTNYRRLSAPRLRELVKEGAGRRPFQVMSSPRLPLDFAMDPNHAKTVFIQFE
jgi:23S rRNA (guanine2445-N2)-methyltransferase / 23S rRNA (guanine2069-N7)-methyltransferase